MEARIVKKKEKKRKEKERKKRYNISLVTFIETLHGNHDTYDDE